MCAVQDAKRNPWTKKAETTELRIQRPVGEFLAAHFARECSCSTNVDTGRDQLIDYEIIGRCVGDQDVNVRNVTDMTESDAADL